MKISCADASGGRKEKKERHPSEWCCKSIEQAIFDETSAAKRRANDLWSRILRWAAHTRRPKEVNERGSKATNGEQKDDRRKTVRFEQEALNTSTFSDPYVALEHSVRDETPSRPGSVLVQKSFEHISALDVFYEKDERKNRRIGEELERYEEKMLEISREVN